MSKFTSRYIEVYPNSDRPAFEAMFKKIEERFLHHVRHLVTLERWPNQHHGPHGRYYVVGRCRLLKIQMDIHSARLIEMYVSRSRRNRPQDSLTYVGLREHGMQH